MRVPNVSVTAPSFSLRSCLQISSFLCFFWLSQRNFASHLLHFWKHIECLLGCLFLRIGLGHRSCSWRAGWKWFASVYLAVKREDLACIAAHTTFCTARGPLCISSTEYLTFFSLQSWLVKLFYGLYVLRGSELNILPFLALSKYSTKFHFMGNHF